MNWIAGAESEDIRYDKSEDGQIAKITINRPEVRNAVARATAEELADRPVRDDALPGGSPDAVG